MEQKPSTAALKPRRTLSEGMRGEDVLALQVALREQGFPTGVEDGIYGVLTKEAVREFQKTYGLARDGIAGPEVIKALKDPTRPVLRVTHIVREGENLTRVAQALGVSVEALLEANWLKRSEVLYAGERLFVDIREVLVESLGPVIPAAVSELSGGVRPAFTAAVVPGLVITADGLPAFSESTGDGIGLKSFYAMRDWTGYPWVRGNSLTGGTASFLANPKLRDSVIAKATGECVRRGLSGLWVELFGVKDEDYGRFAAFMRRLSRAARERRLGLACAVPAKTAATRRAQGYAGYDYEVLSRMCDRLVLVPFIDRHNPGPDPVAPYELVQEILRFSCAQVRPWKLVLALPLTAVAWDVDSGAQPGFLGRLEVSGIMARYVTRPEEAGPWERAFSYKSRGRTFKIWHEDIETVRAKVRLTVRHGIRGTVFMFAEDAQADVLSEPARRLKVASLEQTSTKVLRGTGI